ncbi:MAG: superfamily I DNA and RNA helicase [Cryomorphaceae bacterium]|jgi:superfamily I DNA and RNA helicase
MNYITFNYTIRLFLSLVVISALNSCETLNYESAMAPSAPAYAAASSGGSLNRNSVSSAKRVVVKTGSLNLDAGNVREASESIEKVTAAQGGHMLSYNERDDKHKRASFSIRVPAEKLVRTMDEIGQLGKVTYRKITVKDRTREGIAQKARLVKLRQRKARIETMYRNAKNVKDKLTLEKTLAEIEEEIFSMEEGLRQMQKFARFSKLDISLSQKTIRGPVGATLDGAKWTLTKLFTISE